MLFRQKKLTSNNGISVVGRVLNNTMPSPSYTDPFLNTNFSTSINNRLYKQPWNNKPTFSIDEFIKKKNTDLICNQVAVKEFKSPESYFIFFLGLGLGFCLGRILKYK